MTQEELAAFAKLASQNAWRRETATTVNSIVEDMVLQVCSKLLDEINDLHLRLDSLEITASNIITEQSLITALKTKPKGMKIHAS